MKYYINILLISLFFFNISNAVDIQIKYKINNEIITNQDIVNEINYLIAMNKNLSDLSREQVKSFAINSVIQEKIKFIELKKSFDLENLSDNAKKVISKNILLKTNTQNKDELIKYLNSFGIKFEEVETKFKIELLWNKFIYDRFNEKVSINKDELKNKINKDLKNNINIFEYNIREILFEVSEKENLNSKLRKIKDTIKSTNFGTAATIYSISNTSNKQGEIGWIKETQLSKEILTKIKKLNINEFTEPLIVGNGYLILELNDLRKVKEKIDVDKELKILVEKEIDRQLNQYSTIYFNKIKKNVLINEI